MCNILRKFHPLCALMLLASCADVDTGNVVYSPDTSSDNTSDGSAVSQNSNDPFLRQRIIADMLYEARLAYEDNRLTSPAGDNAYDGFRSVLDFDPENEVAQQGIHDIVLRYIELVDAAIQISQFDNAESLLNRAASIDREDAAVAAARVRLEQARDIDMEVFALDAELLNDRGLEIMVELGEIGQYIRDREAVFLINARTDEEGRWIYQTMRQALGGYRLRGNIAVDIAPSIQVVIPKF
jgi:tetratricopeptide (TPR) repeat protein